MIIHFHNSPTDRRFFSVVALITMLARCLTFALIVAVAAAEVRNTRRCDAPALHPRTFRRAAACACKTADRAPKLQGSKSAPALPHSTRSPTPCACACANARALKTCALFRAISPGTISPPPFARALSPRATPRTQRHPQRLSDPTAPSPRIPPLSPSAPPSAPATARAASTTSAPATPTSRATTAPTAPASPASRGSAPRAATPSAPTVERATAPPGSATASRATPAPPAGASRAPRAAAATAPVRPSPSSPRTPRPSSAARPTTRTARGTRRNVRWCFFWGKGARELVELL